MAQRRVHRHGAEIGVDLQQFPQRQEAGLRTSTPGRAGEAGVADGADRTLAAFLRIPRPLYDLVFGREWFVDPARPTGLPVSHDIFEGLS